MPVHKQTKMWQAARTGNSQATLNTLRQKDRQTKKNLISYNTTRVRQRYEKYDTLLQNRNWKNDYE